MTARQWRAGDVAVGPMGRVMWLGSHWIEADGGSRISNYRAVVRPLLVIDPDDYDQVTKLMNALWAQGTNDPGTREMQAALRSLLAPPKPEEPSGRYAAVRDRFGGEWVRLGDGPAPWMYNGSPDNRGTLAYADIDAVEVLTPGVGGER